MPFSKLSEQQQAFIADRARVWEVRRFCQVLPSVAKYVRGADTSLTSKPSKPDECPENEPDGALAALLRCLVHRTGADLAMISLLDDHTQYFVSGASRANFNDIKVTLDSTRWYGCESVSHHGGLCERTITMQNLPGNMALYEELDMTKVDRTKDLPFVTGDIAKFRYYAGVPLNPYGGPNIGTVFIFCETPSETGLSDANRGYLFEIASHIIKHLEQAVEALEGKRMLRFNKTVASLLDADLSSNITADALNEPAPGIQAEQSEAMVSNLYTEATLRLYQLAATLLNDTFEFDGVRIHEVDQFGSYTNHNPDWNGSKILAQHLGPMKQPPVDPSQALLERLLDMFPQGCVIQMLEGPNSIVAATNAGKVVLVIDQLISTELPQIFPKAKQIIMMPLWDTHRERNIGTVLGFSNDQSRVYLGSTDLWSISALCTTLMTQVRRLEVQAMDKIKSDFLGSMSHEMRTPLHGILSALELLSDTPYNADQRDLLETARYSGISLLNTIEHVLHFSKISSTARVLDETRSNGSSMWSPQQSSPVYTQTAAIPTKKHISKMVNVCEEAFQQETRRLRVKNNAIKFNTPVGCVRVSLDVDETSCTLCFTDAGKGINPDFLRHSIFDAFSQEDPLVEGTGLGLSIVKRTVTALGGQLDVDSKETRGSTFTVKFPSQRVVFDPSHVLGLGGSSLPELQMSVFVPSRWTSEGEMRSSRCTEMLLASLTRSLSRWFQVTVSPWESSSTDLRLLIVLEEDLADAKRTYGDEFHDARCIVLCPDLQASPTLGISPLEGITTLIGPVTLSNLQDALARLFPDLITVSDPHDDVEPLRGSMGDSIETTLVRGRQREEENNITPGDGAPQGMYTIREAPYQGNDTIDEVSLEAASKTGSAGQLDRLTADGAAKLPINHVDGNARTKELVVPTAPLPPKSNLREPKLLLVDDNPVNLKVLGMYARKCSKTAAKSVDGGQKAIDAFKAAFFDEDKTAQRFDLIFLDLSMPEVSGFDVARQIREIEAKWESQSRVYICALTGLSSDKDRNAAYASGVDQYLVKPARLDDLQWVLTEEAVELQQCARRRNPNTAPQQYPGSPPQAESTSRPEQFEHDSLLGMAATTDSAFVEDVDVERELEARVKGSSQSHKPGVTSPGPDTDNEDAPLLRTSADDYGSAHGDEHNDSEEQWAGHADFRGLPWWKRPSIYWLLPPFLLFTTAFGGIIVPKINLIMDLVCEDYYATLQTDPISSPMDPGQDRCQSDVISSRSSLFLLYASLCSGLLSAIISPKIGALSDRYGRKKFMIANTCGTLLGEIITILAAKFPETVHVNWILVGYCFEGISGSFIVGMACAHSYASDVVAPQKRNVAFSYFHACLFGGIAIGPVLAGYIINAREKAVGKTEAVLLIFYMALGAHLFFIAFLTFFVPESLSKARQEAAREKYQEEIERNEPTADWINQLRSVDLFGPLKILWPTGPGTSSAVRWNLVLLAATDTIMFGVAMGAMSVVLVYTRRQFDWHEFESGRFTTIVNSCRVFSLLVILPVVTRIFRGKNGAAKTRSSGSDLFDLSIIRAAILFDMMGYLGFALVRRGELFALSGALASIGGIGSPTLGAALTKHVPQDQVGQLLGATGLLHAVARVMGPTIFNGIYSATVGTYRQTVFVSLAATFGLAFLCSWFIRPHVYIDEDKRRDARAEEPEI
ncbi:hypothetical protein J3E72DRAFT_221417 [Bipolaris maydis]|nr:hypothetical protein J3E74DRAFT_279596 [Bipolaris maydis]KAJ6196326.1 hypothetical protein J3E72DRAFT_221417 [Bipolaris maydis]KAJ6208431.1 hypothetical protein PSV09DRAFT_2220210 [Bipolaris maydis]